MIYVNLNDKNNQSLLEFEKWFCSLDRYAICALLNISKIENYFDMAVFFNELNDNFQVMFNIHEFTHDNVNVISGCALFNLNYELINSNITQKIINVMKQ